MTYKLDKNKINAVVLFGGKSVEHDVSIITAVQLMHAIDKTRFNVLPVYITRENICQFSTDYMSISSFVDNIAPKSCEVVLTSSGLYKKNINKLKFIAKVDFVFNSMHGSLGENGTISGHLDAINIPYSSSGVLSSGITMDKYVTKLFCENLSIPYAKYCVLYEDDQFDNGYKEKFSSLSFPLIVKPACLGSSVGITFCQDEDKLKEAIDFAFLFDNKVIVEQAISHARELNISVMQTTSGIKLSKIEEVCHTSDFLSFEDKYLSNGEISGGESRIFPAQIDESVRQKIEQYSTSIFKAMMLKGVCRIDYLLGEDGNVYLNEINSIPGSLSNYLWRSDGYSYKDLLNSLYDFAIYQKEKEKNKITTFSSTILSSFTSGHKIKK